MASPLARSAEARGLLTDALLEKVVEAALPAAAKAGASWADVRVVRRRDEGISTRDAHVSWVSATESYGLRFNQSPVALLRNVEALGKDLFRHGHLLVPAVRAADFKVASVSAAS